MTVDLAVANGLIVTSSGRQKGTVSIDGGKIVGIGIEIPDARLVIDASGLAVFPGFIDNAGRQFRSHAIRVRQQELGFL